METTKNLAVIGALVLVGTIVGITSPNRLEGNYSGMIGCEKIALTESYSALRSSAFKRPEYTQTLKVHTATNGDFSFVGRRDGTLLEATHYKESKIIEKISRPGKNFESYEQAFQEYQNKIRAERR